MFVKQTECFDLKGNSASSRDNHNKMSNGIYTFLNTEITCLPKAIGKLAGKYYSNAHCNGATWLFVLWTVLHIIFDKYLDGLLSKLKYKPYIRSRIKDSLWYLGFFGTAAVYCWATLRRDEVELFNFKKMHVPSETNISDQVVGYTLICTFYLHSSIWEGLKNGSATKFFKYLCLAGLCTSSYILRVVEIAYTLTGIIGVFKGTTNVARIFYSVSDKENRCLNIFNLIFFVAAFGVYTIMQVVVIPLTFIIPLGLKILSDYPNILLIFLFLCLMGWFTTELYHSILFNLFDHWLYHKKEIYDNCSNNLIECSLFLPRDDESFHLQILRKEAKERQQEMIGKRKPKNRSMLLQTLKCMVAIKRKISEKRSNDSSDSESEKSDEGVLIEDITDSIETDSDELGKEISDNEKCKDKLRENNQNIKNVTQGDNVKNENAKEMNAETDSGQDCKEDAIITKVSDDNPIIEPLTIDPRASMSGDSINIKTVKEKENTDDKNILILEETKYILNSEAGVENSENIKQEENPTSKASDETKNFILAEVANTTESTVEDKKPDLE